MMNEGLSCSTNLEANSNFTSSNSGADGRDGIWANSSAGLGLGDIHSVLGCILYYRVRRHPDCLFFVKSAAQATVSINPTMNMFLVLVLSPLLFLDCMVGGRWVV